MSCPDPADSEKTYAPAGDPDRAANALFHDLSLWREQLARSIARNNLALRSGGIATATNRLIFSLLFLRIAEDRGLVEEGTLQEIAGHTDRYGQLLEITAPLAVLFDGENGAPPHEAVTMGTLVIEDRVLHTILIRLIAPDLPYRFTAIETEIVAEVLSRYLTRTIRRSAVHQADVVDTHDTVLSSGMTLPPCSLVRYLTRSSLQAAEKGRSKRELLPLRVIDPACGTGLVLVSAFRHLLAFHGGEHLTFEERHAILMGSLHGVDSSRHAVSAAMILILFTLCEGSRPVPQSSFLEFSAGIVRELRHAIRCGDALIGPDITDDDSWSFCPARERHAIHAFAWRTEFPEIFSSGGFDAVICSQPRRSIGQREWVQRYLQRHFAVYDPSADRSAFFIEKGLALLHPGGTLGMCIPDSWLRGRPGTSLRSLLITCQIDELTVISKPGGNPDGPGLCILEVTSKLPARPPRVALVDPGFSGDLGDYITRHAFPVDPEALGEGGWSLRDTRAEAIVTKARQAGTPLEEYVMGELHTGTGCLPLQGLVIDARARKVLVSEDPRCKLFLRPVIAGTVIGRYEPSVSDSYVVFIPEGWTLGHPAAVPGPWRWFRKRHPQLARLIREHVGRACGRAETGTAGEIWWETRCEDEIVREKSPRIFFQDRFTVPVFAYDDGRAIPGSGAVSIITSGPYLAGVLNSRLTGFLFAQIAEPSGRERTEYSWDDLRNLPVYTPDFDNPADAGRHNRIVSLVIRLIDLRKQWSRSGSDEERALLREKIEAADRKIDRIVYELYGLTADEIAVVESTPPS